MRAIISIVFSAVFLMSGIQISLDRHFCHGELADVRISLSGKLASCGMEVDAESSSNPFQPLMKNVCCDDQLTHLELNSRYLPQNFDFNYSPQSNDFPFIPLLNPFDHQITGTGHEKTDMPPGKFLISGPDQPMICIFRI